MKEDIRLMASTSYPFRIHSLVFYGVCDLAIHHQGQPCQRVPVTGCFRVMKSPFDTIQIKPVKNILVVFHIVGIIKNNKIQIRGLPIRKKADNGQSNTDDKDVRLVIFFNDK